MWYFQAIQLSIHAHVHFVFTSHCVLLSCIRLQHITLFKFSWDKYTKHEMLGSWPFRVWSLSLPCFHRYETNNIFDIEHTVITFLDKYSTNATFDPHVDGLSSHFNLKNDFWLHPVCQHRFSNCENEVQPFKFLKDVKWFVHDLSLPFIEEDEEEKATFLFLFWVSYRLYTLITSYFLM